MSDVPVLYERNAGFAASFDQGDLPIKPKLSSLILTCVDARLGPEHFAGLDLGEALVLRNVGGRVTDAVALEVSVLFMLMGMASGGTPDMEVVIIQHTNCGMARFADPEVAAKVTERFGSSAVVDTYAIADLDLSVTDDIARLRDNPSVPRELKVSGHVYDVTTGALREVVSTQPLG